MLRVFQSMNLTIEKYSDISFVVRGNDTKLYKSDLKSMGGKWNRFLKNNKGEISPGWIFSNRRLDSVNKFISGEDVVITIRKRELSPSVVDRNMSKRQRVEKKRKFLLPLIVALVLLCVIIFMNYDYVKNCVNEYDNSKNYIKEQVESYSNSAINFAKKSFSVFFNTTHV